MKSIWYLIVVLLVAGAAGFIYLNRDRFKNKGGEPPSRDSNANTPAKDHRDAARANLERLAAAVCKYQSRTRVWPNNIYATQKVPLLSWRVAILPDLGYESLYKEFNLAESWDSEHNARLISKMPAEFYLPGPAASKSGETFVQGFVAPSQADPRPLFRLGDPHGIPLLVEDGLSNTAMFAEAANSETWTKPTDIMVTEEPLLPRIGTHYGEGTFIGLLDGRVLWFPTSQLNERTIRAIASINENELE